MRVRWRLVIGALIAICVLIMGYFYVSPQETNYAKKVNITKLEDVQIANDMVKMAYASKEKAIFYYSFGLFVYDIQKQKIYRSIDLKAIDCYYINGSTATAVISTPDGRTVYIYNMGDKADNFMYKYDVEANKLIKMNRSEIKGRYKVVLTNENPPDGYEEQGGAYSPAMAPIDKNTFAFMYAEGFMAKNLQLIVYNRINNEKEFYNVFHQ